MRITPTLTLGLSALFLVACGKGGQGGSAACPTGEQVLHASDGRTLCVALSTVAEPPFQTGFYTARVTHRIHITDDQGRPVDITHDPVITEVSHHPVMEMVNGHRHSTPHAHEPEESSDPAQGLYDLVAYYVMPSGTMMGQWTYEVLLDDAGAADPLTAVFTPQVKNLPNDDDRFFARVGNDQDRWTDAEGNESRRPYQVWLHEVRAEGGAHRFTVFLSVQDSMAMQMGGMTMNHTVFHALVPGETQLHRPDGSSRTVGTVVVQASTDDGVNWSDLSHQGEGRYEGTVSLPASGERAEVRLRIQVDGLTLSTPAGKDPSLSFEVP